LCGILGDIEVNDLSAVVAEDDKDVEKAKCCCCNDEHIERHNVKARQVGEGTLGRDGMHLPTVAWLISIPSFSSFAVDPGRTPKRVGQTHMTDQIPGLCPHIRAARTARS
jgi:hypothetical protein